MKKLFLVLFAAIALCFTACQRSALPNQDVPAAYESVLEDYKALVSFRLSPDFESLYIAGADPLLSRSLSDQITDRLNYQWSCMLIEMVYGLNTPEAASFGYILQDINRDGSPELFWVRDDRTILAAFCVYEGEAYLLDAFWSRYECVVTDSGDLCTRSNDAWNYSTFQIKQLAAGSYLQTVTVEFGIEDSTYYEVKNGDRIQITETQFKQLQTAYPFQPSPDWESATIYYLSDKP